MNIEALDRAAIIEAVTAEVMRRLKQSMVNESVHEQVAPKKQAVLLTVEPAPELESMLSSHYEVRYYDETLRDCDLLIIPNMCIQLLSNLANGISAGPRERFVLTMLLKGRQVVALEEGLLYRKYKATAPVLLYKLYDGYADKLAGCGIHMVKESELLMASEQSGRATHAPHGSQRTDNASRVPQHSEHASHQVKHAGDEVHSQLDVLKSKVITEAELKKYRLQHGTKLVIDRKSIITPLAQDYLRMQNMQVHRR